MKKKDIYCYPAVFSLYDSGIGITFPDFPCCVSHGDNDEDALSMAKEALSLHILGMAEKNKSVNRPVTLPAWLNAVAVERGVNFSQVLQSALIELLNK